MKSLLQVQCIVTVYFGASLWVCYIVTCGWDLIKLRNYSSSLIVNRKTWLFIAYLYSCVQWQLVLHTCAMLVGATGFTIQQSIIWGFSVLVDNAPNPQLF